MLEYRLEMASVTAAHHRCGGGPVFTHVLTVRMESVWLVTHISLCTTIYSSRGISLGGFCVFLELCVISVCEQTGLHVEP